MTGSTASTASGQLKQRLELTYERLLKGTEPAFTDDFILADLIVDPGKPRRFDDFSGDLSGRFIGAMAIAGMTNIVDERRLHALVDQILAHQRADGRFGLENLSFETGQLDREHMALLWGNGRMLVGLLEYHSIYPEPRVLDAATRLAEFLHRACDRVSADNLNRKLETAGAYGFICLTQCNEGLAMLYRITGERKWVDLGLRMTTWLAPRGTQHSHGVLTTLRGQLMLHEITKDRALLDNVQRAFNDIVQSRSDYLVFGGVPEYFGALSNEQARSHTGGKARDEGCSEADFLRLCLQLWQITNEVTYLEQAEHCFMNHLCANQFENGDFGSRMLSRRGFGPSESPGRAWWCCTMHGLRAFHDITSSALTRADDNLVKLNLYVETTWSDESTTVEILRQSLDEWHISVSRAPTAGLRLSLRQPEWSAPLQLKLNGKTLEVIAGGTYINTVPIAAGSTVELKFDLKTRLIARDGSFIALDQLTASPIEAALFHGPWLMGVSAADQPMFFSEPSMENRIRLAPSLAFESEDGDVTLDVPYQHEGYAQPQRTNLRWVGGSARNAGGAFAVWLHYHK